MDLKRFIGIIFLSIFSNSILLSRSEPSNFLQYFTPNFLPYNPLFDWISRRTTKKPNIRQRMCKLCTCGLPNINNTNTKIGDEKIVGGYEVQKNKYPWIVMLKLYNMFYCAGTLITEQYVLTAAHCIRSFPIDKISARILMHNRTSNQNQTIEEGIERKVKSAVVHSKFNYEDFDNDIGIIYLDKPVLFDDVIRPVCLPDTLNSTDFINNRNNNETKMGTVIGWGTLSEDGELSPNLQEIEIPIINTTECLNKIPITRNMFCAGLPEGKKDSCQGDSGGPLMIISEGRYVQMGIVSWGDGCGKPEKPGVYTLISNYLPWIKKHIRDGCFCSN